MPELPEVETVRRSLLPLVGDTVADVDVREPRLRHRVADNFASQLIGRRIEEIRRRAKYLLFGVQRGETLLVHLGMSGTLILHAHVADRAKHDHVIIRFHSDRELVFNDPRRFGLMKLGREDEFAELRNVGPDPLAALPSATELRALCRGRKRPIKNVLMDQQLLGGIGNIYASEILFRAGVRPRRQATNLTMAELGRILDSTTAVLGAAVALGGSSISDYRDGTGKPGYFQIQHRVYDRGGEPCRVCGTVIRRIVLVGRSTFYCPSCQR